jgi:hypothetical protein
MRLYGSRPVNEVPGQDNDELSEQFVTLNFPKYSLKWSLLLTSSSLLYVNLFLTQQWAILGEDASKWIVE